MSGSGVEIAFSLEEVNAVGLLDWRKGRAIEARTTWLIFRVHLSTRKT